MLSITTIVAGGSFISAMPMLTFILCYLLHHRHTILTKIRELPHSTILFVDLAKVKLNLKIELIVYNFLIVICVLELLTVVLVTIDGVGSVLCVIEASPAKIQFQSAFGNANRTENVSYICFSEVFKSSRGSLIIFNVIGDMVDFALSANFAIVSLFLIVLRRLYLNLPYKQWIRFYTVWIALKFIPIIASPFDPAFRIAIGLLLYATNTMDFAVYISCSHSFYRLLKGRTMEAKWHSSPRDYKIKQRISTQFYYTQIYYLIVYFIGVFWGITILVEQLLLFFRYRIDNQNTLLLKLFDGISTPSQINSLIQKLSYYNSIAYIVLCFAEFILVFLGCLIVCIGIVFKLLNERRRYKHVNDWATRPLMEMYRATLEDGYRNHTQRPPFIQAFRSGLVY